MSESTPEPQAPSEPTPETDIPVEGDEDADTGYNEGNEASE